MPVFLHAQILLAIFELKLQYRLRPGKENKRAYFALRPPFAIFTLSARRKKEKPPDRQI